MYTWKAATRMMFTSLSLLIAGTLVADDRDDGAKTAKNQQITRSDGLPETDFEHATDAYLEGYIQALIDMHYHEFRVIVLVRDHKILLGNLPKNDLISHSIISFVQDVPGVTSVEVQHEFSKEDMAIRLKDAEQPRVNGVWFPQTTVLFPPLIADPRQPMYYVAYRFGDHVVGKEAIAVALGDDFPIFRWSNVFRWRGDLQIDIEAGVWAVFNFHNVDHSRGDMCELFNTDYLLGFPLSYAVDRWAFRLRPYHISGHLGDEFICSHQWICDKRKNPSFEAIDFYSSYQMNRHVRLYVGPGVVIHSDDNFKLKPLYVGYGTEIRVWGRRLDYHKLYGTPFLAIFIDNWQQHHWDFDFNAKAGYELTKLQGVGRNMRLYVAYHHGFSWEGQFFNERTQYGEVGFSWGF
ncbi:MAG: DUF1207 domain-containing protein [Anaplasmataceae bacterium]|nr:DUF1207 domain-containing protein [Anaplasmataceae bacterium]